MKELCRVIKYAIDTKNKGLKLRPEDTDDEWKIKAYSDVDFAGDKESWISVTGYVIYFMNVPICWRSRGQKGVTLSTTEAEYVVQWNGEGTIIHSILIEAYEDWNWNMST